MTAPREDAGSRDDRPVKIMDVDRETVLALFFMPDGGCTIRSQLKPREVITALRTVADTLEKKLSGNVN